VTAGAHQHHGDHRGGGGAPSRAAGRVEKRERPDKPLDVLVQHIVTIALGGGFRADELFAEVRTRLVLPRRSRGRVRLGAGFCERGGESLTAYPEYHRIVRDEEACYRVRTAASPSATAGHRHHRERRGDAGEVHERRQHRHDGGRLHRAAAQGRLLLLRRQLLEFVRVRDMAAYVQQGHAQQGHGADLAGSKMACPPS
jgi:ATP-dependent Lhr-like helicase